jgi:hypothetical protein
MGSKQVGTDVQVSAEIVVISKPGSPPEKKINISQGAEAQNVDNVPNLSHFRE